MLIASFFTPSLLLSNKSSVKLSEPKNSIVSFNNHPTEHISQFVDFYLKPLVSTIPTFIKDTTDFLNKLAILQKLPNNPYLVTFDVISLYTKLKPLVI